MPTKREVLEDRTIEELRQMAREKDLSGYSNLEKSELIDLVEKNYTEEEVRDRTVEDGESQPEKSRISGNESGERTEKSLEETLKSNFLKIVIIGAVIGVLGGFSGAYYFGISSDGGGRTEFVSDNYGFSFEYPSDWTVRAQIFENTGLENKYGYMRVAVGENIPENEQMWRANLRIDDRGGRSFDNIKSTILSRINLDNIISQDTKKISGFEAFDITVEGSQGSQGSLISRGIFAVKKDRLYTFSYYMLENLSENKKSKINSMLDSFELSE